MKRPTRRDREAARTREDILDAAARAFARTGYAGTTMESLAKEAGYTVPTLYRYFDSKVEIVRSLVTRTVQELLSTFDEPAAAGLTFRQRLELLLDRQFEFAERRREAFAVLLTLTPADELLTGLAKVTGVPAKALNAEGLPIWAGLKFYEGRLAEWFRTVASKSELGGHDPAELANVLAGIEEGLFRRRFDGDLAEPLTSRVAFVVSMFLYGVTGNTRLRQAPSAEKKQ